MRQKGFATIFGLCLILIIALIVKGIQEAEANHAREVLNFEMEQALQSAADGGIVEAAEFVRQNPAFLPKADTFVVSKKNIPAGNKIFRKKDQTIEITVKVWGERGKIYIGGKANLGVYFMSRATINSGLWGEKIYRRAYAYVLSEENEDGIFIDDTKIHFMELP